MMREKVVNMPCAGRDGRVLEGRLLLQPTSTLGVIVCHPYGMLGGNLHNNVVVAVTKALGDAGFTTLRFNFRGVGRSSGRGTWRGDGEMEDLRTAIRFLCEMQGGPKHIILIGELV